MTIFCVKDGDDSGTVYNFPLKKVVPAAPVLSKESQYIPTTTPGVVIDSRTGRMETQIPIPEVFVSPVNHHPIPPVDTKEKPIPATLNCFISRRYGKSTLLEEFNRQVEFRKETIRSRVKTNLLNRPPLIFKDDIETHEKFSSEEIERLKYWFNDTRNL